MKIPVSTPVRLPCVMMPAFVVNLKNISVHLRLGPITYSQWSERLDLLASKDELRGIMQSYQMGTVDRFLTISREEVERIVASSPLRIPQFENWYQVRSNVELAVAHRVMRDYGKNFEQVVCYADAFWQLRSAQAFLALGLPVPDEHMESLTEALTSIGYRIIST